MNQFPYLGQLIPSRFSTNSIFYPYNSSPHKSEGYTFLFNYLPRSKTRSFSSYVRSLLQSRIVKDPLSLHIYQFDKVPLSLYKMMIRIFLIYLMFDLIYIVGLVDQRLDLFWICPPLYYQRGISFNCCHRRFIQKMAILTLSIGNIQQVYE